MEMISIRYIQIFQPKLIGKKYDTIRSCPFLLFQTQNSFLTKCLGNSGATVLVKEGDTIATNRVENTVEIKDEIPKNVEVLLEHNKILQKYCGSIIVWDENLCTILRNSDKSESSKKNHKDIITKYLILRYGISLYFKFFASFIINRYESYFSEHSEEDKYSVIIKMELSLTMHGRLFDFVKNNINELNKQLVKLRDSKVRNAITYEDNVLKFSVRFAGYMHDNFKVQLNSAKYIPDDEGHFKEHFNTRDVIAFLGYEASGDRREDRESSYDELLLNRYKSLLEQKEIWGFEMKGENLIRSNQLNKTFINLVMLQTTIFLRRNPISHLRYSYTPDYTTELELMKITPTVRDSGISFYQKTVGKTTDFRVYFLNGYTDRVSFMLYHIITHPTFFFALLNFKSPTEKNVKVETIQLIEQGNLFQEYKTQRRIESGVITKKTKRTAYLQLHTILRKELNMKKPFSLFSVLNVLSKIVIDSDKLQPNDVFLQMKDKFKTELSNAYKNLCLDYTSDIFCKSFFALHPHPIMRLNFPYKTIEEAEKNFVRFDKIYVHGNFAVHFSALNLRDIYGFLQKPMFFKKHNIGDELDNKLNGEAAYYILDKKTGSFIKKRITLANSGTPGEIHLPIDGEETLPDLDSAAEFFRNPKLVTQFNQNGQMIWKFEYKFGTKQLGMIKVMVDDLLYNNLISSTVNSEKDNDYNTSRLHVAAKKRTTKVIKKNLVAINIDDDYSRVLFSPLQRTQDASSKTKQVFKENEVIDLTVFNENLETIPVNEPQNNPFIYKNESKNAEVFQKQNLDLITRLNELGKMWIVFHTIYKFDSNDSSATSKQVNPDLLLKSQDNFKQTLIENIIPKGTTREFYIFDSERDIKRILQ